VKNPYKSTPLCVGFSQQCSGQSVSTSCPDDAWCGYNVFPPVTTTSTTTTIAPTTPQTGDFVLGQQGVDACPPGYVPIFEATTCSAASAALALTYDASANDGSSDGLCNFCGGCSPKTTRVSNGHGWLANFVCQRRAPITTTTTTTTIESTTPQTAYWKTCRWQSTQDRFVAFHQHLLGWTCADNEILTGFGINEDEEDDVSKIQCCELGGHSSVIPETCTYIKVGDEEFQPERASCNANDHMVFSGAYDASFGDDDEYIEMVVGKCCEVKCDAPWCRGKDWGVNTDQCFTISADTGNMEAQDLVCPEGTLVTQVGDGHSGDAHGIQNVASVVCCELDLISQPTRAPSTSPTTSEPTTSPTTAPSPSPTSAPSLSPTKSPSLSPTTSEPTKAPSKAPTKSPSLSPTKAPSPSPTSAPSLSPTRAPSQAPTSTADCLLALAQCNPPLSEAEILKGIEDCLPGCRVPSDYIVRETLERRLLSKSAQ
jgi:hypothetical protein